MVRRSATLFLKFSICNNNIENVRFHEWVSVIGFLYLGGYLGGYDQHSPFCRRGDMRLDGSLAPSSLLFVSHLNHRLVFASRLIASHNDDDHRSRHKRRRGRCSSTISPIDLRARPASEAHRYRDSTASKYIYI
jgi:hypothetical protein